MIDEHYDSEIASLEEELKAYREEKEKIRMIVGQIGGAQSKRRDLIINISFAALLIILIGLDITAHFVPVIRDYLPMMISLEIGLVLVSIKIIWMIHQQSRVEHFQFWILNSIEFRINDISKRLKQLEERKQ
jgi:hypothetical protein